VLGSGETPQLILPPSLPSSALLVAVLEMLPWSGIVPLALQKALFLVKPDFLVWILLFLDDRGGKAYFAV